MRLYAQQIYQIMRRRHYEQMVILLPSLVLLYFRKPSEYLIGDSSSDYNSYLQQELTDYKDTKNNSAMNGVVHLQAGGCGNKFGTAFYQKIGQEHGLDETGKLIHSEFQGLPRYYRETQDGKYTPRAILFDSDASVLDSIRGGSNGRLFEPSNFIYGNYGSDGTYSMVYHQTDHKDKLLDTVRREVEACDSLQGFQIVNSVCGGTGSGFLSNVVSTLREEYATDIVKGFTLMPSINMAGSVLEPYNAVLSMLRMVELMDMVTIYDNDALYQNLTQYGKYIEPSFDQVNQLFASSMTEVTSSIRFPGLMNTSLRKIAVNMVPFPRLHFFVTSLAPGNCPQSDLDYRNLDERGVVAQLWSKKNFLSSSNVHHGSYHAATSIFRGNWSALKVQEEIRDVQYRNSSYFTEWIPDNVHIAHCNIPPSDVTRSASLLANSTGIHSYLQQLSDKFSELFSKKAFIHRYIDNGMDEMEFTEAQR
jgi:tubulin beta